jgi:hypothetical protein
MTFVPPIRAYHSTVVGPPVSVICSLMAPKIMPNPSMPTAHPTKAPRCRRQTRPDAPRSPGGASAFPRRSASKLLPTSRRVSSMLATPISTTKATANNPSGHRWSPPNGRICCPHPIGDNQAGHALSILMPLASTRPSMFPTPLTTNVSPRAAAARPLAPRVVEESCAVTAAIPANTMPSAPTAVPVVNEPAAGCPVTIPASPSVRASPTLANTVTMTAAARPECRPTTAAPTNSALPVSSFWRLCRMTAKALIRAARTPSRK